MMKGRGEAKGKASGRGTGRRGKETRRKEEKRKGLKNEEEPHTPTPPTPTHHHTPPHTPRSCHCEGAWVLCAQAPQGLHTPACACISQPRGEPTGCPLGGMQLCKPVCLAALRPARCPLLSCFDLNPGSQVRSTQYTQSHSTQ